MKHYLLPKEGNFYKANLHCHSTVSDGQWSPEKIKEEYMKRGYSIVAFTDHDILIPHNDLTDENFLALNGYEVGLNDDNTSWPQTICCHIGFISLSPDNNKDPFWNRTKKYLLSHNNKYYADQADFYEDRPDYIRKYTHKGVSEMMQIGRDCGFYVIYNHPQWSFENYSDYMGYQGMHAFEIYNHASTVGGWTEYNDSIFDDFLRAGRYIHNVAADDNHNGRKDSFGGWINIKAPSLTYENIAKALLNGDFYSSEGPSILDAYYDDEDDLVHVKTSPVKQIALMGESRTSNFINAEGNWAKDEPVDYVTECAFHIPENDAYFRIHITDEYGKHADSNPFTNWTK